MMLSQTRGLATINVMQGGRVLALTLNHSIPIKPTGTTSIAVCSVAELLPQHRRVAPFCAHQAPKLRVPLEKRPVHEAAEREQAAELDNLRDKSLHNSHVRSRRRLLR